MKILIRIAHSPLRTYSIDVPDTKPAAGRVLRLAGEGRYGEAIMAAFSGGVYEGEVAEDEIPSSRARLILTETSAHWDLCGR